VDLEQPRMPRVLRALGVVLVVTGAWLLAAALDNPHHPHVAIVGSGALVSSGLALVLFVHTRCGRLPATGAVSASPAWGSLAAAGVFTAFFFLAIFMLSTDSTHRATYVVEIALFLVLTVLCARDAHRKLGATPTGSAPTRSDTVDDAHR
jgi:hypothetical protein